MEASRVLSAEGFTLMLEGIEHLTLGSDPARSMAGLQGWLWTLRWVRQTGCPKII